MNLVIDIGNTQAKLAWFEQGRLTESVRTGETGWDDLLKIIRKKPVQHAILSSVGHHPAGIETVLGEMNAGLLFLSHNIPLPFSISYDTPETLGHDRIAAAAGARYVCPFCNVMIIDMGTAITIDFVSAEGQFTGGNISPGLQTRFRALSDYTARLPLMSADPAFPYFGTGTGSAITAGVQQGILYELNGYIDDFARKYPACEFILTGGDAEFFFPKLKGTVVTVPDLVLKGLNYILEFNLKGINP